jgi:uncharacterized protein
MDTTTPPAIPGSPAPAARTWEMLAHLSALAGFLIPIFGNLLGPFVIWQIKKAEFPSVETHAKQALNFQISCLIYFFLSVPLIILFGIGFFLMTVIGIFSLVCTILATIKVNNGEPWKYPLSLNLIK